jgi:hypothetical protein
VGHHQVENKKNKHVVVFREFPKYSCVTTVIKHSFSTSFGPHNDDDATQDSSIKSSYDKKSHPFLKGPRKGASPQWGPYGNRHPFPEPSFTNLSGSTRAPTGMDTPFSEPSFIHLSKSLVNEPPSRFPNGASVERDACLQSLPVHIL